MIPRKCPRKTPSPEVSDLPPALMILASFLHHAKLSSALFAFSARNGLVRLEQIHVSLTGSSNHSESTKPEFSPFFLRNLFLVMIHFDWQNKPEESVANFIDTHNVMPKTRNFEKTKWWKFRTRYWLKDPVKKIKNNERNAFLLNLKKKRFGSFQQL